MEPRDAALLARLRWIVGLRWLAAAGVVVCSAVAAQLLGFPIPLAALQAVGMGIACYNCGFRYWLYQIRAGRSREPARSLVWCADMQIGLDLAALLLVIHLTGGAESPLSFLLVFHMVIGSMTLPGHHAYAQASGVVVLYAGLIVLEAVGAVPHLPLGLGNAPDMYRSPAAWPRHAVLLASLYVVVYLASTVSGQLRRREEQLGKLTRELAQQADALRAAYGELKDAQSGRLEYMRRVAHELKSPLSAICMMIRANLETSGDSLPAKVREALERLSKRAASALELTEDLLTLSQLREALPVEELSMVSLEHVIDSTLIDQEVAAEQAGVVIEAQVQGAMPQIRGYRVEMMVLLRNLVSNAIKFSPPGSQVLVQAFADGSEAVVQVHDQGMGIASEEIGRVFDEFYRTAASRRAGTTGTGLGLAIARSIAAHHGGTITARSVPGQGTEFEVRLPIAGAAPEPGADGPPAGPPAN